MPIEKEKLPNFTGHSSYSSSSISMTLGSVFGHHAQGHGSCPVKSSSYWKRYYLGALYKKGRKTEEKKEMWKKSNTCSLQEYEATPTAGRYANGQTSGPSA